VVDISLRVADNGLLQFIAEMCGFDPFGEDVKTALDLMVRCSMVGQPVLAYAVLHFIANMRIVARGSTFIVPRKKIPYISSLCILRLDDLRLSPELMAALARHGYGEPSIYQIREPVQTGEGEARDVKIRETTIENLIGVVAYVEDVNGLEAYTALIVVAPEGDRVEVPPPEVSKGLLELCSEKSANLISAQRPGAYPESTGVKYG